MYHCNQCKDRQRNYSTKLLGCAATRDNNNYYCGLYRNFVTVLNSKLHRGEKKTSTIVSIDQLFFIARLSHGGIHIIVNHGLEPTRKKPIAKPELETGVRIVSYYSARFPVYPCFRHKNMDTSKKGIKK